MSQHDAVLTWLGDLAAEPVRWLWPDRLALGKLSLIDGDPSQGKSLVTIDLAARFSKGAALPDGYQPPEAMSIIFISAEDGIRDTILPRAVAADADVKRMHVFQGCGKGGAVARPPSFPEDCSLLERLITDTGARLVFADPFMAFLSNHLAAVNDQMVRQALSPLAGVAEATGAAIVLVRHLNKGGNGQRAIYRGSGSIGVIGAARTAFLVGRDPEEPELRLLACTKNNLAGLPSTLGYRIERSAANVPRIAWTGPVEGVTADELVLAPGRRFGEALAQAVTFLCELLQKGPAAREEVFRRARGAAIADRTLVRAKAQLQVVSQQCKRKDQHVFYWCLPEDAPRYTAENWDNPEYRQQLAINQERDRMTEHLRQFNKPLSAVHSHGP